MKKVLISVMALITVLLIATNVMAATTGAVTLTASTAIVKAKDEFTVIVKASDSNNLNTVEYSSITITDASGKEATGITLKSIDYDDNVWAKFKNDEGFPAFVCQEAKATSKDVFKLTFTVSDNISAGTYNINVNGLTVYSSNAADDTTKIGTKTVSVVVETEKADDGNTGNEQGNNTGNNNSNEGNKQDNTESGNNKLPQTGIEDTIVYAITTLGAVSIVAFISYRRYRDI